MLDTLSLDLLEKAVKVLDKYSLCDHCLGRLFARVGYGLENYERGQAIKNTIFLLTYYTLQKTTDESLREKLLDIIRKLARTGHEPSLRFLREKLNQNIQVEKCYICEDKYFNNIDNIVQNILETISSAGYEFKTYYVGTSISREVVKRELDLSVEFGIDTAESIKRELNRLIGKKIKERLPPDKVFSRQDADIEIVVNMETGEVKLEVKPLYILTRYRKIFRGVSQVQLRLNVITSLQKVLNEKLATELEAAEAIVHASGREDTDVRMLGDGRPLVIAFVRPRKRPSLETIRELFLNKFDDEPVELVDSVTKTQHATIVKLKQESSRHTKIYRAIVLLDQDVDEEKLRSLEQYFRNRQITQYTPRRIKRKPLKKRVRMVYELRATKIAPRLIELLIKCQGGLYVKELITGDEGRTTPSIADTLGINAEPIELDVLDVLETRS